MKQILLFKQYIDILIFLLRDPVGYFIIILLMTVVELFGVSGFFKMTLEATKMNQMNAQQIYVVGYIFAGCMAVGVFSSAIQGHHNTSACFAFAMALLSVASFSEYLTKMPDLTILNKASIKFVVSCAGILVLAVFPSIFIALLSHELHKIYQKEGFPTVEKLLSKFESYSKLTKSNKPPKVSNPTTTTITPNSKKYEDMFNPSNLN